MSLQKLCALGRCLARSGTVAPINSKALVPTKRMCHIVAVRPKEQFSKVVVENAASPIRQALYQQFAILSSIMVCCIYFTPAWVIFHMNEYTEPLRKKD